MSKTLEEVANDLVDLLNGETDKLKKKYDKNVVDELNEIFTGDPKALQKKYQNEAYDKYVEKFSSSIPLWKLNDKEWVHCRKEVWQRIIEREKGERNDFVKSYWEEAGRFFLRAKPRKNDSVIYVYRRMAYTPFSSVEEIRELYMNEHVSLRRNLHEQLLSYASRTYRAVPEEFYRVKLIADALYCKEYVAKKSPMGHANTPKFSVFYPRDFIIRYTGEVRKYLNRSDSTHLEKLSQVQNLQWNGHERSFAEVTIDYFLGSLEYAVNNNTDEYGGVITETGIEGVNQMCELIESYSPDIHDENRDKYVEVACSSILENDAVKKVRARV
ncbi:hypothetical protein GCM10008090_10240 [Arenicella chitinivorans]|uniref:Uncharacterized protein n=1 Tax=Arenicella chitinivorans TaxID=1329800 RepID=A0A918RK98_9GAMM|nr:hypothetical protein [Arenicella chitinivorans]GHA03206.1 hypothetical protein GCM10008090_10240 [Arenicella chitinivorans]